MVRFGSEPRFEPEPVRTEPKFSSGFRSSLEPNLKFGSGFSSLLEIPNPFRTCSNPNRTYKSSLLCNYINNDAVGHVTSTNRVNAFALLTRLPYNSRVTAIGALSHFYPHHLSAVR